MEVVVVDYTLLSVIKKTVIPVDDIGIQGNNLSLLDSSLIDWVERSVEIHCEYPYCFTLWIIYVIVDKVQDR